MDPQPGRKLTLKRSPDGVTAYTLIAGARTDTLKINNEYPDVTDKGDNGIRTLLDDIAMTTVDFSTEGVWKDESLLSDAVSGTLAHMFLQVDVEGIGTVTGKYAMSDFQVAGAHNGEATFTAEFKSTGAQVWAAAP